MESIYKNSVVWERGVILSFSKKKSFIKKSVEHSKNKSLKKVIIN